MTDREVTQQDNWSDPAIGTALRDLCGSRGLLARQLAAGARVPAAMVCPGAKLSLGFRKVFTPRFVFLTVQAERQR